MATFQYNSVRIELFHFLTSFITKGYSTTFPRKISEESIMEEKML
jgi:hypothetical protein